MPIEHITRFRCGHCGNVEEYAENPPVPFSKLSSATTPSPHLDATEEDIARMFPETAKNPEPEDDHTPAISVTVGSGLRKKTASTPLV